MNIHLKSALLRLGLTAFVAILAVIVMPHTTFAEAGTGAGGSGSCTGSNYCTSYGAVWQYRTTNSNSDTIPGLYGTTIRVTGCASYGGFFQYVLTARDGSSGVRSWAIGRTTTGSNSNTYRSVYFGGQTAYRPSINGATLPPTLVNGGAYSWGSVRDAFNAMPTPQKNGYSWDGNSRLGWFCYSNFNFNLTPTISTNPTAAVTAGGTVDAIGAVNNGGPTSSRAVDWQISQIIVPVGQAVPTASGDSANNPRAFYGNTGFSTVDAGNRTFGVGTDTFTPRTVAVPDLPVGTRMCFVLSINPFNQTTTSWRHSSPRCVVIAKRPVAQILGGDLRVGAAFVGNAAPAASNIQAGIAVQSNRTYGSWGEYGLIASGSIVGAASGSAYSGGLPCVSNCQSQISRLSFTNATSTIGRYVATTNIPDVAASFGVSSSTPQYSSLADAANRRVVTSNSDITIAGGTIQKGDWLVINAPTRTVTITGDITYATTPLQAISDIPQLVIIANRINIAGNVNQIDAWLVASGAAGTINTCSSWNGSQIAVTDRLVHTVCSAPLTVNGPVMAKSLYLRRTTGADNAAQIGNPAEVINLRPDAYLWATAQASKSSRLETTYSSELPPRF